MKRLKKNVESIRLILVFFMTFLIFYLLKTLSSIVLPLILAFFFSLLLYPVISFLHKKGIPSALALVLSGLLVLLIAGSIIETIRISILQLYGEKAELTRLVTVKMNELGLSMSDVQQKFTEFAGPIRWSRVLATVGGSLTSLAGSMFIMLIYLFIILGGMVKYKEYFRSLEEKENGEWLQIFEEIKRSISIYIQVKFFTSFATGLCFGLTAYFFNLDFPLFWGFMAFCLNFIPSFGSFAVTIVLILFGGLYISYANLWVFALLLVFIQVFFGNIVEPKFLDYRLSINMLTILFGLIFWGYILGPIGLLLAVPLLVLVKLILKRQNGTKILAKLME
ncbi:pheromone autoinducer 2 transporter (plasmid) [Fulvitalea axinellae]|uniref:Pheromone autoinducer 2 transporter n=1 Tax=Fulvitalea axinellae TaxID=1182444 RepID=A0AAU9DD91_9BACT|nr:pheromone autoinducer 2 transporter [Fulvitalea axinellae]